MQPCVSTCEFIWSNQFGNLIIAFVFKFGYFLNEVGKILLRISMYIAELQYSRKIEGIIEIFLNFVNVYFIMQNFSLTSEIRKLQMFFDKLFPKYF